MPLLFCNKGIFNPQINEKNIVSYHNTNSTWGL
jgi:hypothetical protein